MEDNIYTLNIDPELKKRIDQTIKGVAKIFANDVVNGKKNLDEMLNDIDNSEIPDAAKKWIVFHMGMETTILGYLQKDLMKIELCINVIN